MIKVARLESGALLLGAGCLLPHSFLLCRKQTKMEGGQSGTYQRLMIGVVESAGDRRKDVEMKRKREKKIYNN